MLVDVASNPLARARGLMGRTAWEGVEGMLFVYPWPRKTGIWMAGTHLPLDAVFVDRGGRIVGIARDLQPFSKSVQGSTTAVKWLVELPAGRCESMGLSVGDNLKVPARFAGRYSLRRILKWLGLEPADKGETT